MIFILIFTVFFKNISRSYSFQLTDLFLSISCSANNFHSCAKRSIIFALILVDENITDYQVFVEQLTPLSAFRMNTGFGEVSLCLFSLAVECRG